MTRQMDAIRATRLRDERLLWQGEIESCERMYARYPTWDHIPPQIEDARARIRAIETELAEIEERRIEYMENEWPLRPHLPGGGPNL